MSNHFSTPPASNRFTSRCLSTYTPPTGGGPFGPESEAELIQPSPHFLDRGLEALRQKQAKGAQQLAVAVQPHAADVVPVAVPGAPRTALAVAQATTTAVQLLTDPEMTTEELRARAGALLVEGALRGTGHRPERPSVWHFFSLPAVQRGHWHCHRCKVINRRDEPKCCSCGDTYESIVGVVPEAELQALRRVTQGTAYGRALLSLAGREQDVRAGAPVEIGAAGYEAALREQLRSFQHQANAQRVEPAVKGAIMTVDGWLALKSSGMYRLFAADDVRKFMGSGDFEVVMAEFVETWGRRVHVPHLGVVQVMPKGGWWWHSLRRTTEHDMHLVRAIVGMYLGASLHAGDALRLYDLINTCPVDDSMYRQLSAVVASIFARMAVRERSATGRARRAGSEGQVPVDLQAFVHNGLAPPRILVATLVRTACSRRTGARLVTIERFRVQQSAPIAHVLTRGRDQGAEGGKPHVLVRLDGMGTCWLPEERLRSFPSGARCIEQYDALQLDGFGRAPLEHLLVVQALDPTLLCANCEYRRSDLSFPWRSEEASRAKGPPSLCHFCHDAGHKAPKVASGPRGHSNASNAPPALPPATRLAVEQSFSAAHEDAEAEAVLLEVLIARRTVGRQGGASAEQERDLMHRALLLCRGDREAALGADEAGAKRKKGDSRCGGDAARRIGTWAAHPAPGRAHAAFGIVPPTCV